MSFGLDNLRSRSVRNSSIEIDSHGSKRRINFLEDSPSEMTYGRRIGLYLMTKKWYNPHVRKRKSQQYDSKQRPSLAKAWAYFEHYTLPRYIYKPEDGLHPRKLEYAKPGENVRKTKLYSPISTLLHQMGDFGIGMGLYFSALRSLVIVMLIAGLIQIPNMMYFASENYNGTKENLSILLKGSAICTDTSWVPCPSCKTSFYPESNIIKSSTGLLFVKKNNCQAPPFYLGMTNLAVIFFILIAFWVINKSQKKMQIQFALDEQTARNYSIQITNPPSDAHDPQEWIDYFAQIANNAHVTCITISVNNDVLLRSLVKRRERYNQIKRILPPGTPLDDTSLSLRAAQCKHSRSGITNLIAKLLHPFGFSMDIGALLDRVILRTYDIRGLSQLEYPVTNVFVTFETEKAQRKVLSELNIGSIPAFRNNIHAVSNVDHLFRSKYVIHCVEPEEPSTINWENLNVRIIKQLKVMTVTFFISALLTAFMAWLIEVINRRYSYLVASAVIAIGNVGFPELSKIITDFEPHKSESGFMTSLYLKITVFRYVNTVIVINMLTHFVQTLDDGRLNNGTKSDALIPMVAAVFFADVFTTNALQLMDPWGHFKRHVLAPRENYQDFMNIRFQGKPVTLAERYTNLSKIIFQSFYYCAIFPGGFFLSTFALFINYYVDKFCIMRTWARSSKIGTSIGKINMKYILALDVLAMSVLSAYFWSGYPFDNLCETDGTSELYAGSYNISQNFTKLWYKDSVQSKYFTIVLNGDEKLYKYCNQHLMSLQTGVTFPPTIGPWMTNDQKRVVHILGWTSVAMICLLGLRFLYFLREYVSGLFRGIYEPIGYPTGINFSDVRGISCYIPQVESYEFSYPLIGSVVDDVDTHLFEWKDPDKSYEYYNVVNDARSILFSSEASGKRFSPKVFSQVYYYPAHENDNVDVFVS